MMKLVRVEMQSSQLQQIVKCVIRQGVKFVIHEVQNFQVSQTFAEKAGVSFTIGQKNAVKVFRHSCK